MAAGGVKIEPGGEGDGGPAIHGNVDCFSHILQEQICGVCGIDLNNPYSRQLHEKSHAFAKPWTCAVCSVTYRKHSEREVHELKAHGFLRHEADRTNQNAVRIRKSQLAAMFNVGFKLLETQQAADPSPVLGDEEATDEELRELMRTKPHRPLPLASCDVCGMKWFWSAKVRQMNVDSHQRTDGYQCSLCGIYSLDSTMRNIHERQSHGMNRHPCDRSRKEAIRIMSFQWPLFRQRGTNFREVQRTAVPSDSPTAPSVLVWAMRRKKRKPKKRNARKQAAASTPQFPPPPPPPPVVEQPAKVEVITLSDSEDEQPTRPCSSGLQSAARRPLPAFRPPVQVVPPMVPVNPRPVQPTVQFAAQSAAQPTVDSKETKASRLMIELFKRPELLYYDYQQCGPEFGTLPLNIWSNSAACALLLLRLAAAEWTGNTTLPAATLRFTLRDVDGHFLLIAKEGGRKAVDRLVHSRLQDASFRQLMETISRSDLRSALIVVEDSTHASIGNLASDRFVLV